MDDQSKITRRRALQMVGAVAGLAAGGARGAWAQAQPQMQLRIERLALELDKIISVDEPIKELASGFGGPLGPAEGPLWWKEGGYLLFTDIHHNRRMKYTPGNGAAVDLEPTNRANGLTRDLQGRLLSCEHDTRRVTRRELDGGLTVLANSFQGRRLNRPNDVVVKSDGAIYFTDPRPQRTGGISRTRNFSAIRLKKNSKQCSSMTKLKRKRLAPPFQPTPLDNSTGTDVCSPISSFAIWFRCTSSGPSASRRARACA